MSNPQEELESLQSKGIGHLIREYLETQNRIVEKKKDLAIDCRRGDTLMDAIREKLMKVPKGKYYLEGQEGWRVSHDGRGIERIEIDPTSLAELAPVNGAFE